MFGMSWADTFRVLLMGLFILVCIAITIVVLMQESKQTGLSGAADTYWGKNKGRSIEGKLVLFTKILAIAFIVIAAILNINF